jgi:hypothetical protein
MLKLRTSQSWIVEIAMADLAMSLQRGALERDVLI